MMKLDRLALARRLRRVLAASNPWDERQIIFAVHGLLYDAGMSGKEDFGTVPVFTYLTTGDVILAGVQRVFTDETSPREETLEAALHLASEWVSPAYDETTKKYQYSGQALTIIKRVVDALEGRR